MEISDTLTRAPPAGIWSTSGGAVMLYRPARQPYVDLDLTGGAWDAVHPCGADRYEVSTVVRSRDVVQEYWRVQGPDKDYTAVTTLRRVA